MTMLFECYSCDVGKIQPEDPTIIEVKNAPKELEEGGQSTIDELTEIHLGSEDNPRPTYVSMSLNEEEKSQLKNLLLSFVYCFAWNSREMPGLDP